MHRKSMTYARSEATSCCELPGATASPIGSQEFHRPALVGAGWAQPAAPAPERRSAVSIAASGSFRTPTLCSSVLPLFFILFSSPRPPLAPIIGQLSLWLD